MIKHNICLFLALCLNPWLMVVHATPSKDTCSRGQLLQITESISEAQELANQKNPIYTAAPSTAANKTLPLRELDAAMPTRNYRRIDALLSKVKETPSNANALNLWRGLSFWCQQRYEEAAENFDRCTNFDDASLVHLYTIGLSYFKVEECHKAVKVLTAVIAKFPDRDSYSCRANCYMALKMYDQAISDFLMAAKFSYSYRSLYIGKAANVLRVQKKYKEAIAFYAASLKNSPNDFIPTLLLGRALCFQELKRWNEAVQDYTEAIKVLTAPTYKGETKMLNLADSYFQRAKCYDNLGKASLAAADRRSHAKLSSSFANDFLSK